MSALPARGEGTRPAKRPPPPDPKGEGGPKRGADTACGGPAPLLFRP
ncbi:hypothetical protein HMPREF0262_03441 [Clostridium sp. ATCC 29733]|nr:hypothetical protein HMPREF0262_03441 [Clostridium sp. ATCC 29733]